MRLFVIKFLHDGGDEETIAMFRMTPSRKVWEWFTDQRDRFVFAADRLRMFSCPDAHENKYVGEMFPDLSRIRMEKVAPGRFRLARK